MLRPTSRAAPEAGPPYLTVILRLDDVDDPYLEVAESTTLKYHVPFEAGA